MTDKYGSDPQEHDDVAHDQPMSGEGENWTGEPPVDDFHAGEEGAVVSEETEAPEDNAGATTEEVKKKSLPLPIIAGIGVFLIAGAFVYLQFSSASSNAPAPVASVPPLSTQTPTLVAASDTTSSVTQSNDVALAPPPATSPPADVAPTTGFASVNDQPKPVPVPISTPTVTPTPETTSVALPPKPPLALAGTTTGSKPQLVAPPTAVSGMPVTAQPASAPKDNAVTMRLDNLSARLDDMQKALTQAVQQLSQASATVSTASPPESNSAVDDRLNKLEQKVMQLQSRTPSRAVQTVAVDTNTEAAPDHIMVRTYIHHKAKHKKTVSMRTKRPHTTTIVANDMQTAHTFNHWVLRAATPDEAWVATDSTSPELRHIQVGDDLPGIGTVRGIHQNGDSWIVEGSQGTLR